MSNIKNAPENTLICADRDSENAKTINAINRTILQLIITNKICNECDMLHTSVLNSIAARKNDNVELIDICINHFNSYTDDNDVSKYKYTQKDIAIALLHAHTSKNMNIFEYLLKLL